MRKGCGGAGLSGSKGAAGFVVASAASGAVPVTAVSLRGSGWRDRQPGDRRAVNWGTVRALDTPLETGIPKNERFDDQPDPSHGSREHRSAWIDPTIRVQHAVY